MGKRTLNNKINFHWGLITSLVLTVLFAGILTTLIINGMIAETQQRIYSDILRTVACTIGFIIAGKLAGNKIAVQILVCAGCYCAVILFIGLVILDGSLQNIGSLLLSVTVAILLACASCIRKPKHRRVSKRAYRA